MIAMQYGFTLPADYDMSIIERRIADKGPLLDHFPGLRFKAYQFSRKDKGAAENRYAPFYLWEDPAGIDLFLFSEGFASLCAAFGRPEVGLWPVWHSELLPGWEGARYASLEILPLVKGKPLAQQREQALAKQAQQQASGSVLAFDPKAWRQLRYQLWQIPPTLSEDSSLKLFEIGYLASSHVSPN